MAVLPGWALPQGQQGWAAWNPIPAGKDPPAAELSPCSSAGRAQQGPRAPDRVIPFPSGLSCWLQSFPDPVPLFMPFCDVVFHYLSVETVLFRNHCKGKVSVLDTQSQPSEPESLPWPRAGVFGSPFRSSSLPRALLQNSAGAGRALSKVCPRMSTNQAHMDVLLHMLNILLLSFSSFPSGLSVRLDFVFPHHGLHRK